MIKGALSKAPNSASDLAAKKFFTIIPNSLIEDSSLENRQYRILSAIKSRDWGLRLFPTRAELAKWCGCSLSSIYRDLKALKKAGRLNYEPGQGHRVTRYSLPDCEPFTHDRSERAPAKPQAIHPSQRKPVTADRHIRQHIENKQTAVAQKNSIDRDAAVQSLRAINVDERIAASVADEFEPGLIAGWATAQRTANAENPAGYALAMIRQREEPPVAATKQMALDLSEWHALGLDDQRVARKFRRANLPSEQWPSHLQNLNHHTMRMIDESIEREDRYKAELSRIS